MIAASIIRWRSYPLYSAVAVLPRRSCLSISPITNHLYKIIAKYSEDRFSDMSRIRMTGLPGRRPQPTGCHVGRGTATFSRTSPIMNIMFRHTDGPRRYTEKVESWGDVMPPTEM